MVLEEQELNGTRRYVADGLLSPIKCGILAMFTEVSNFVANRGLPGSIILYRVNKTKKEVSKHCRDNIFIALTSMYRFEN